MSAHANPSPRTAPALRAVIRAIGLIGLGGIAIAVGLADVIARAPVDAIGVGPSLAPPSQAFPFGTDLLGRDMFSETLHALAITLGDAIVGALVAVALGGIFGFVAARLPWRIGDGLRVVAGILAAVPALLLAILFVGLTARGFAPVAAGLAAAPFAFARAFDRARLLGASHYAQYARASGIRSATLLRRDLAYEVRDNFLSTVTRALAAVAITLATLSFFGFGAVPPARDLGLLIASARAGFLDAWWTAACPAFTLMLLILCARLAAGLDEGERP
ncbi:MAG TPA: hypothetical protein VHW02_11125 [Rhizomicrobium sp.]|jgi:peptide/nickel transport system permease protein|nr:hypothetical protein [Rhizomicrobium sp.]